MNKSLGEMINRLTSKHYSDEKLQKIEINLKEQLDQIIAKKANQSFDNLSRSIETEIDAAYNTIA